MKIPICINCNEEMKLEATTRTLKSTKGTLFKRRRYYCNICDYTETIAGDGYFDIDIHPLDFKEQEKLTRKCI